MQVQGTCEEIFLAIKNIFQQSFDNKEENGVAFENLIQKDVMRM